MEAERLVRVGARVLRVGGAAGGRLGAVRGATVALRLGGPRGEHCWLDRDRVFLYINILFNTILVIRLQGINILLIAT